MGGKRGKNVEGSADSGKAKDADITLDPGDNAALSEAASLDHQRTVFRWMYEYCCRHKLEQARAGLVNDVAKKYNISHDELKRNLAVDDPLEALQILVNAGELDKVYQDLDEFFADADRSPSSLFSKVSRNLRVQMALESLKDKPPRLDEFYKCVKLLFSNSSKDKFEVETRKELLAVEKAKDQDKVIEELLEKYPREEFVKDFTDLVVSHQQLTKLDAIVQDMESGHYCPTHVSTTLNQNHRRQATLSDASDKAQQALAKVGKIADVAQSVSDEATDNARGPLYLSAWELRDACGLRTEEECWSSIHQQQHPRVVAFLQEMSRRRKAAKKAASREASSEVEVTEVEVVDAEPQTQEESPLPRTKKAKHFVSAGKENIAHSSAAANPPNDVVNVADIQVVKALRESRQTLRSVVQDPLEEARRVAAGVSAPLGSASGQNGKKFDFFNPDTPGRQCEWSTDDDSVESPKTKIKLSSPTSNFRPKPRLGGGGSGGGSAEETRKRWTAEETENLKEGVKRHGVGRWAKILSDFDFQSRTQVDLKDKWRNLEKHGHV